MGEWIWAMAGMIVGALLAVWWAQSRRPRELTYWQEDVIMRMCPHETPVCLDCGAMLPPPNTYPRLVTGTAGVTRWYDTRAGSSAVT